MGDPTNKKSPPDIGSCGDNKRKDAPENDDAKSPPRNKITKHFFYTNKNINNTIDR
jgi:hypothetical protein